MDALAEQSINEQASREISGYERSSLVCQKGLCRYNADVPGLRMFCIVESNVFLGMIARLMHALKWWFSLLEENLEAQGCLVTIFGMNKNV